MFSLHLNKRASFRLDFKSRRNRTRKKFLHMLLLCLDADASLRPKQNFPRVKLVFALLKLVLISYLYFISSNTDMSTESSSMRAGIGTINSLILELGVTNLFFLLLNFYIEESKSSFIYLSPAAVLPGDAPIMPRTYPNRPSPIGFYLCLSSD